MEQFFFTLIEQINRFFISRPIDPSDPNTFSYFTQNAAEGNNNGLELNIDALLHDESLDLFANLGFLNTEIKNWISRPDLEGREQAHAPKNSFSARLQLEANKSNLIYHLMLLVKVVSITLILITILLSHTTLTNINYGYEHGSMDLFIMGT